MELEEIKRFLRIDFDNDDDILGLITSAAEEYIKGAVGSFDYSNPKMRLLFLNIVSSMYENRLYTVDTGNEHLSWINGSILLQLQLECDQIE